MQINEISEEGAKRFWEELYLRVKEDVPNYAMARVFCKDMLEEYGDNADEAFYDIVGCSTLTQYLDDCDNAPAYANENGLYNDFAEGFFGYLANRLDPPEALDCLVNTIKWRDEYSDSRRTEAMDAIFMRLSGETLDGLVEVTCQG